MAFEKHRGGGNHPPLVVRGLKRLEIHCVECNEKMRVACCHVKIHEGHDCLDINEVYEELRDTLERCWQLVLETEKKKKNIDKKKKSFSNK